MVVEICKNQRKLHPYYVKSTSNSKGKGQKRPKEKGKKGSK